MTWIFSAEVCRTGIGSAITASLSRDTANATQEEGGLR